MDAVLSAPDQHNLATQNRASQEPKGRKGAANWLRLLILSPSAPTTPSSSKRVENSFASIR